MLKTKIEYINGNPMIDADGVLYPPLAYTTYFDECAEWSDFIVKGYKLFFVNVSFTDLPINNVTRFSPFRTGVFESENPDYSSFDTLVSRIVSECPDALIFPRINIAMPKKWIRDNPNETVITPSGARESIFSDAFMRDGAELLKLLVNHIRSADYADRIAGYQLCGGTTQEWMHHDLYGSFSDMGLNKFREWAKEKYGIENIRIPDKAELGNGIFNDEIQKYFEFSNEVNTKTIEFFAKILKEHINYEQIAGVFYGYCAFVNDPLLGLHGLGNLINSPYIDFFSSPCCYDGNRRLGIDWGDMIPVDSVRLNGKLCFIECDIRTHLTKRMQDSRPDEYPDGIYQTVDENGNKTVWSGPETEELSVSAIRKAFAHQLSKGSGIWWFDMWGGWYHSDAIMAEIAQMHTVYNNSHRLCKDGLPRAETAFFIDEKAYFNYGRYNHFCNSVNIMRVAMGNSGIPFDVYMIEDAEKVIHKYKAVIFSAPVPTEKGKSAVELCKKLGIPFISADTDKYSFTTDELRVFLVSAGIHCYNADGCVVYCSNGIIGIHTDDDGEFTLRLPKKYKIRHLLSENSEVFLTDKITLTMQKHRTEIFALSVV